MKDKKERLRFLQMLFVLPMFVLGVTSHGPAIDVEHAHNAALFHLAVTVVGVIGGLTVQVKLNRVTWLEREEKMKAAEDEAAKQPGVWPPPPQA